MFCFILAMFILEFTSSEFKAGVLYIRNFTIIIIIVIIIIIIIVVMIINSNNDDNNNNNNDIINNNNDNNFNDNDNKNNSINKQQTIIIIIIVGFHGWNHYLKHLILVYATVRIFLLPKRLRPHHRMFVTVIDVASESRKILRRPLMNSAEVCFI